MAIPCSICQDTLLDRRDWMGPTPQAPMPRMCPECVPDGGTKRQLQNAWATWLHTLPSDMAADMIRRGTLPEKRDEVVVLIKGWTYHSEGSMTPGWPGIIRVVADADIVMDGVGWVVKDRFGATPRRATPNEISRAKVIEKP